MMMIIIMIIYNNNDNDNDNDNHSHHNHYNHHNHHNHLLWRDRPRESRAGMRRKVERFMTPATTTLAVQQMS